MQHTREHRATRAPGIARACLFALLIGTMPAGVMPAYGGETNDGTCLAQRGRSSLVFPNRPLALPGIVKQNRLFGCDDAGSFHRTRLRTWIRVFGNWTEVGGSGSSPNLNTKTAGLSFGLDQQFGRNFLVGASFGGSDSTLERKNRSDGNLTAAFGSAYFRTTLRRLFLDVEGGIGYNDPDFVPENDFQWNLNAEVGTWWEKGLTKIEPYFGLRHVALDGQDGTETKTTLLTGLRYSWKTTGTFAVTSPRFYVGLLQELGDRHLVNTASFVDSPTVYALPGYELPHTRLFCGGGFTSSMGKSLDLYLRYTAEIASSYAAHTLLLGMNWNF